MFYRAGQYLIACRFLIAAKNGTLSREVFSGYHAKHARLLQ